MDAGYLRWCDQGADICGWIKRIAYFLLLSCFSQLFRKIAGQALVDKYPLNRNAYLSGMVETALSNGRNDFVDNGSLVDNDRGHSAMLQGHPGARC